MYFVLLIPFSSWLSLAGALSIFFPPDGKPTAALDSQTVTWKRDKSDPNEQFFLQKIKLDNHPSDPTVNPTPVSILNSQNNEGVSPMAFNRAGLFQVLAINKQNEQTFFSTEVTVLPNPTSSAAQSHSTLHSETGHSMQVMQGKAQNTSASSTGSQVAATITQSGTSSGETSTTTIRGTSITAGADSMPTHPVNGGSTVAIIGGVVGAILFIFAIGVIILWLRYRTRRRTTRFTQTKMVRDYVPDVAQGQWTLGEKNTDLNDYPPASFLPSRTSTLLRPQDSISNVSRYVPPILPPIPAVRSVASSDVSSSNSGTSSAWRSRDRKTPSPSISTLSSSTGDAASESLLFPVPSVPRRIRTARQMLIEEDIQQLQARMLSLQENGEISPTVQLKREEELKQIYRKVELLKKVHESEWALGLTNEIPAGRLQSVL